MNKDLKKALLDQKIRKHLKEAIQSAKSESVNEANLYTTFVEPFQDAFAAVKITSKEILSNVMMVAGQVLTLSPEKQEERMRNYEERQKKIEQDWKPIMDSADKWLSTGDADLVALAFAPQLYLASSLGASAYNAAEGVGKYLDDLGLKKGLLSVLPGVSEPVSGVDKGSKAEKPEKETSLLDKLHKLFLGTSVAAGLGALAIDQVQKRSKKKNESVSRSRKNLLMESEKAFEKDMTEYLDQTGLDTQFESMQESLLDNFKSIIEEFDKVYEGKKSISDTIVSSSNSEEMFNSLKSLDAEGIDAEVQKIQKEFETSKTKLAGSPEFADKLKEQLGKEELASNEIEQAAEKSVFADFVTEMKSSMAGNLEEVKKQIAKDLEKVLPSEKTLSFIQQTKTGIPLLNLIRDAKSRYNIT